MIISFRLTVISVLFLSCRASAFSTLFVTEGADEGRKTEGMVTKTQKTEGSSGADSQVIVETIPFFTDVFTKVEDVMNLTPLKVATIISAQHLLNTVKTIPVAGSLPQDTLNVLSNIVDEFNKTTQIIKLTAEYVNISSNYILNSLNQFAKENCDEDYVKSSMTTINKKFSSVISDHVKAAVQEITEKTEHREMTGTDVLVSSASHIVAAFQEMTNQVISLKTDSTKCNFPKTLQNNEQDNMKEKNMTDNIFENPKQEDIHKSIKKDQAPLKTTNRENWQDTLTIENVDKNPDLTIEISPHEPLTLDDKNKEPLARENVKIPESLKVAFLPKITTELESRKLNNQQNQFQSQLGSEDTSQKVSKNNLKNLNDIFTFGSINPKEELTVEILSPLNLAKSKKQDSIGKTNESKQQRLESLNVYYYPLERSRQNQNHLLNANTFSSLKVPEDLKGHYPSQNLKTQTNDNLYRETLKQTPFKTLSLFGNYNSEGYNNGKQQKNEYITMKSEGSQTNHKSFRDNLNRQDLTIEVFSPEAFMHEGKDKKSPDKTNQVRMDVSDMKEFKFSPKAELKFGNFEKISPKKSHRLKHFYHKNPKLKTLDRELASSAVDSLSNIPSTSFESGGKSPKDKKRTKTKVNASKGLPTVLMPWGKGIQQFQNMFFHKGQQKHNSCDERVEPVCGIDKNKSNFIIFLNDCQRKHHNNIYKTYYEWANMDTCVGFLLKYSSDNPTKYMNAIPK